MIVFVISFLQKFRINIFSIILLAVFFTACQDTLEPKVINSVSIISFNKVNLDGLVTDEKGLKISNALVTILGTHINTFTDSNGIFRFKDIDVPTERFVVNCQKRGCYNASIGLSSTHTNSHVVQLILAQEKIIGNFSGANGGKISFSNNPNLITQPSIEIPSGGVINFKGQIYPGQVNVICRYLNPTELNFGRFVGGSDLYGKDINSKPVMLYSLGIIDSKLETPNGEPLQIRSGKEAKLIFPIPNSRTSKAQNTISMWYYNDVLGNWFEEGFATREGQSYIGFVKHLSSWNIDFKGDKSTIHGKVIDCNKLPINGALVNIDGVIVKTDSSGNFFQWIPSGIDLKVSINIEGINTTPEILTVPAQLPNSEYNCGEIKLPCPLYATLVIRDCEESRLSADALIVASFIDFNGNSRKYFLSKVQLFRPFRIPIPQNINSIEIITSTYDKVKSEIIQIEKGANIPKVISLCKDDILSRSFINISRKGYENKFYFPDSTNNPPIQRLVASSLRDRSINSDSEVYKVNFSLSGSKYIEAGLDMYYKKSMNSLNISKFFIVGADANTKLSDINIKMIPIDDSTEISFEREPIFRLGSKVEIKFKLVYKDEKISQSFVYVTGKFVAILEKVD